MTALVHAERLGASIVCGQGGVCAKGGVVGRGACQRLYVKDEGLNPTGSFKARGMTTAVSRARQLGAKALATPTAGNAGGALAAYAAAAGSRSPCGLLRLRIECQALRPRSSS